MTAGGKKAAPKPRAPAYGAIYKSKPDMEAKAKEVWHGTVDWLSENGLLTPRRVDVADRYARACAEYHDLYPKAVEDGPVKVGPNGGDVFNFLWSSVEKLNDRMAKFEDALLISPKAAQDKVSGKKPEGKKTAADDYL